VVWVLAYVAVLLSPIAMLALLTLVESRRQGRLRELERRERALRLRESIWTEFKASRVALEAQFLVAPMTAIAEAEQLLQSLGASRDHAFAIRAENTPSARRLRFEELLLELEGLELPVGRVR
jgi:hypothetical protein